MSVSREMINNKKQMASTRERVYLNDGWGFTPVYEEDLLKTDYPQEQLEQVRLPHTTEETPFHYFDESIYQKISGYRMVFEAKEEWCEKQVVLTIEAAAHKAQVYLNGTEVAEHACGYTAFSVNLDAYLEWGKENVLVIKVDSNETLNIPPFGNVIDYMTYGGIYREVYLDICPKSYLTDVFWQIKELTVTETDKEDVGVKGNVTLCSEISLEEKKDATVGAHCINCKTLKQSLWDEDGNQVAECTEKFSEWKLENVNLWSPKYPKLYVLQTESWCEGQLLDVHRTRIGIRKVDFKADGLYINGRKEKLRGLNRHQSFPYVGYAMPASMQRRDADILKYELGVNAVRTSHYPQSHYFLDRCDELGLLVFTEIPGWQHIGDEEWKAQAIKNTEEMVLQYRNHPSIFIWGVRINESMDDDELYKKTNEVAHGLDAGRPTTGVRYIQNSSLLEDVYSYNDFSHDGSNAGCMLRNKVTPDKNKGYLISEYNGHMFPTKSFDSEDHRVEHMIRHANVMDGWYAQQDIAGGFGWCMFDYNTHKDFGSGDRVCYHGVMDMFRNPKLAAKLYAAQAEEKDVLEISSAMDIGEHPACLMKDVYAVTNADSVRLYKNEKYVGEFGRDRTPYKNLPHGPILIDDFIGELMEKGEGFSHRKAEDAKKVLMAANKYGLANLPLGIKLLAAKCILLHGMTMEQAVELYGKYVGNWGGTATVYRFEAVKDGKVVAICEKRPMNGAELKVDVSHTTLTETSTYDVAAIRIQAVSKNGSEISGNLLPFFQEALHMETEGEIEIVGPKTLTLKGGMGGTYVRTTGTSGKGILKIYGEQVAPVEIVFQVEKE